MGMYINIHIYILILRDKLYRFLNIASEALFCRLTADDERHWVFSFVAYVVGDPRPDFD